MDKGWKYLLVSLLSIILITSIVVPIIIHYMSEQDIIVDESIRILKDEDFDNYNFPGNGTKNNPYIIENYNITTSEDSAIYVNSTTKYFIIRNCFLEANNSGIYICNIAFGTANITQNYCINNHLYGIHLEFAPGTLIARNYCLNNYYGIFLSSSSDVILANNFCFNNNYGVFSCSSSNIVLTNNTCTNNSEHSIYLDHSSFATIIENSCNNIILIYVSHSSLTNNTCKNYFHGIYLYHSSNITLTNNTCIDNYNGIYLYHSSHATLIHNIFINCGLEIKQPFENLFFTYTVKNNTVNKKELGFFVNDSNVLISDSSYGQLILINCTKMVIRNQKLSNVRNGLTLFHCDNLTLENNFCSYNKDSGIYLHFSSYIILNNNTCNNNSGDGIYLFFSSSIILTNNTCNSNANGIFLDSTSDNSTLLNNTFSNNDLCGILLNSVFNTTLIGNTCHYNTYGIFLTSIFNGSIINNTLINNDYGIRIFHSNYCLIFFNSINWNSDYAIFIHTYSDNNVIHHNNFIDNNLGGTAQAYDDGLNNVWYDEIINIGNYWSDWIGVGDYYINGSSNSTDPYPINNPLIH